MKKKERIRKRKKERGRLKKKRGRLKKEGESKKGRAWRDGRNRLKKKKVGIRLKKKGRAWKDGRNPMRGNGRC